MMLLLAWLACPKATPPPVPPDPPEAPLPAPEQRRIPVDSDTYWSEPGGLCLEVPSGWRGSSGPAPELLQLVHEASEVSFGVFAWPENAPAPQDLDAGWTLHFADDGGYRTVPILSPASTATWRADAQPGPTRQTWSGRVGGRRVVVAAIYPFGASVVGRDIVEPLLEALCTTFQ